MKDPERQIREFYDGLQMSDVFCEKMRRIALEKENAQKSKRLAVRKRLMIAAAVALLLLSGVTILLMKGLTPFRKDEPLHSLQTPSEDSLASSEPKELPPERLDEHSQTRETVVAVTNPTDEPSEQQPTEPQALVTYPPAAQPTEPKPTIPQPTEPLAIEPQPTKSTDEQAPLVPTDGDVVLLAAYTHTDTNDSIVVTNTQTGESATLDVTGQVTENGFSGTFSLFGFQVYVELTPDDNGEVTAYARIV